MTGGKGVQWADPSFDNKCQENVRRTREGDTGLAGETPEFATARLIKHIMGDAGLSHMERVSQVQAVWAGHFDEADMAPGPAIQIGRAHV